MDFRWQSHYISVFIIFIQGVFLCSEAKLHELEAGEKGDLSSLETPLQKLDYVKNFFLWTREHSKEYEKIFPDSVQFSGFKRRKTFFIIHGFLGNGLESWVTTLKDNMLMREDCNVISVDWPAGTNVFYYYTAVGYVPYVAKDITLLLHSLNHTKNFTVDLLHLVGHSLGAHVSGFVGKPFHGSISRITGLDPAGLMYHNTDASKRLDKSDAEYVDVMHTNGCTTASPWTNCYGINQDLGHTDFWPNGGEYQPACYGSRKKRKRKSKGDIGCNHELAYVYYTESWMYGNEKTLFLSRPCKTWNDFQAGHCSCSEQAQYMGYNVDKRLRGRFYLKTGKKVPYAHEDTSCVPAANGVSKNFYLWTRETASDSEHEELDPSDDTSIMISHFMNRKTYIIIHGFLGHGLEKWVLTLKNKLLMREDCNVISVDWPAGTSWFLPSYDWITGLLPEVGQDLSSLIRVLWKAKDLSLTNVHFIGHSLGAHIAGFSGKTFGGQVRRITALDPAGPGFRNVSSDMRLNKEDAQFVDVMHTNACPNISHWTDCLGLNESIGHADYWPNGGEQQEKCVIAKLQSSDIPSEDTGCSHNMAYVYYSESLEYGEEDTLFLARPCNRWDEYNSGKCVCSVKAQYMGYNVNARLKGNFYLNTSEVAPYARQDGNCRPGTDGVYKHFYLWTRQTSRDSQREELQPHDPNTLVASHFENRTTYFIIHGFMGNALEKWIMSLKDNLLMREDCNVISVDWPAGTSLFQLSYTYITKLVPKVGNDSADLIRKLSEVSGLQLSHVHLIGHSLGAHVSGFTGKMLGGHLGRITGLDPSGPGYKNVTSNKRLDKGDANYVDVIHTNACELDYLSTDCYGLNKSIGHSDIWPNGGAHQPSCSAMDGSTLGFIACDHEMSYLYYTESIMYDDVNTLYLARSCSSWEEYNSGRCSCSEKPQYMGYSVNSVLKGDFYLNTSIKFPYAEKDVKCPPGAKETSRNFFLWTRSSKKDDQHELLKPYDEKSISSSHLRNGKTYIIIHGFTGNGISRSVTNIKDNILGKEDCNVISVDWPAGSTLYLPSYEWTLDLLPRVGNDTVALINVLMKIKKLTMGEIHIIGHGLGAHIAGLIGKEFHGSIAHITGLDPAGPAFVDADPEKRLDKEDAVYVDIIHTSGCSNNLTWSYCLGISDSIGNSDFWPNGGEFQPNCSHLQNETEAYSMCNHEIALVYYAESILYGIDSTYFLARSCGNWEEYSEGNCSCSENAQYMGYNVNTRVNGSFFILTSSVPPFAVQDAACLPGYTGNTNVIIASSVGGSVGVIGFAVLGVFIVKRIRRREGSGLQINEPLLDDNFEPTEA